MPYRTDLKRPDLKGQFPCSVCNKIFCHSSSLSRHRMQAHYKSYTCTQCNQDIHNSENLRSHMYRCHQIHRMFMCRCCNWAFPDKTSLHIHMQSMQKSGLPGDVAVLARSSLDPDVKLAFPDSDGGSTTNSCPEDDHQIFPEETGEISELEEQQQLLKNEENNNIIREQTINNNNNNFISDENNLLINTKKDFLPSPQNNNINIQQQIKGIFPQQNQQQQQSQSFIPSPNFITTEMLISKLGGIINGEKQQQQHLLQNITQSNITTAQTLLAAMLQRTFSKDRLPVPCVAVKNDLLMNDPNFPEASDHFNSSLTNGESNQRLKNTFKRGHKRTRTKMANSEETIGKVGSATKSQVSIEEGNGSLPTKNNYQLLNGNDNVAINSREVIGSNDSAIVDVLNNDKEANDDPTIREQLISEINILKNNNPKIILNEEKNGEKAVNNDISINNQNSKRKKNLPKKQHSVENLFNKNNGLLITKPSLIQNNIKNGPFYSSTLSSPSFSPNISSINGNNHNGIVENNSECFNLNTPNLSAVLLSAAAAMIRNNQTIQNQNFHQQQLNQNFQENITCNNHSVSMPSTPTTCVQNNNSPNNNIKRKGEIVNGILQKLSNKATAEAHSLTPQQKTSKGINKKELKKRQIKTKRSFVNVQTQTEISGEIEMKRANSEWNFNSQFNVDEGNTLMNLEQN